MSSFDLTTAAVVSLIGLSVQVWLLKPGNDAERAIVWSWQIVSGIIAGCLAPILGGAGIIVMALLAHGGDVIRNLYHRWYARRARRTLPILPQRPMLPGESD